MDLKTRFRTIPMGPLIHSFYGIWFISHFVQK